MCVFANRDGACSPRCAVQVWDLRQNKLIYSMHGHSDSITGLSLSSEGSYLLSNSMDNTGRGGGRAPGGAVGRPVARWCARSVREA